MVKGVSRHVILVHPPKPTMYEQAIFIIRDDVRDYTDDMLLKEAEQALKMPRRRLPGPVWALFGAAATACVWLITVLVF